MGIALAGIGCGPGRDVRISRDLRLAGDADSAYAYALSVLDRRPDRMDLWLEFAKSSLELSRATEDDALTSRRHLVEAAIMCAAVNRHSGQRPDRDWRDTGKRVAGQVGRYVNRFVATMSSQTQNAGMFRQIEERVDTNARKAPEYQKSRKAMEQYQAGARQLLYEATVMRVLLESLPELNPGSAATSSDQSKDAQAEWLAALELDESFASIITSDATRNANHALQRATDDLDQLGYFMKSTVLENGVFP